jgi:hypothetical protein
MDDWEGVFEHSGVAFGCWKVLAGCMGLARRRVCLVR